MPAEGWRAQPLETPAGLFLLQGPLMQARVQRLPELFPDQGALERWLKLALQDQGVTSLSNVALTEHPFSTVWIAAADGSAQATEYVLLTTTAPPLLFETVATPAALDASRPQRFAMFQSVTLPAPAPQELVPTCQREVLGPYEERQWCPAWLIASHHRDLTLPYPTTPQDVHAQFVAQQVPGAQGGEVSVFEEGGDMILEKTLRSKEALISRTHLYRWRVRGARIIQTALTLPDDASTQERAALLARFEQDFLTTRGEP